MPLFQQFKFPNASEQQEGIVKIEIMDTGVGMKKESINKLFQPFHQAEKSICQ